MIDADGRITYAHVSPHLHHVPDIYELLDAIDASAGPSTPEPVNARA